MDPHVADIKRELDAMRRQLATTMEPLTDDDINRQYPGMSNTIGILLRHIAGSERWHVHGITGGDTVHRDRDAEFGDDPLQKERLLADIRGVEERTNEVLVQLTADELGEEVEFTAGGRTQAVTKGFALVHTVAHISYHLGQLRLMAAMAKDAREGSA